MTFRLHDIFRSNASPIHLDWIQVEVSATCNASCAYCVLHCYKEQWQGGLMNMKTFECLEPDFAMTDLVFLQGWGEPLLHTEFWDMARRVKAMDSKVGFTTNATALNAANLQRLLDSGIDIMGVSLAGVNPVTHERFRQGCDFARIEAALVKLKAMKQKLGLDKPELHLAFMLLQSNWQELEQLPDLAARWGASQIVVNNLTWIGTAALQDECILLHPEVWDKVTRLLEQTKQKTLERGILLHYYGPGIGAPHAVCKENVLNACFVSYRGDVSPCVFTNLSLSREKQVRHYFQAKTYRVEPLLFGNINNNSLVDIWNSTKARNFRTAFEQRLTMVNPGTNNLPKPCRHCYKLLEQ